MARVNQFAKDLGISRNQAKNLINKGRSRKDGGSQILESVMKKPVYAKNGKANVVKPKKKPNRMFSNDAQAAKKNTVNKLKTMGVLPRKDNTTKDKTESLDKEFSKKVAKQNEKAIKGIKKAMGGLKDVPPGNKGKGLSKLPTPVRNKMGFKKKGGTMKMRGGGMAVQGTGFRGVR